MRHEQSRPGRFDADGEIADGGESRRGRGLAQGQRRGRYGVKDNRAVAIVVTNLESELDNGEARARQRLLGGIDRNDRQPPRCVTRLGHRLSTGSMPAGRSLLYSWLRLVRWRLIGAGGGKCLEAPGAELDPLILGRRPALRSQGLTQGVAAVVETVWHAQPQQTIKLAIVGIAALGSQLSLAVDDREAGAGTGAPLASVAVMSSRVSRSVSFIVTAPASSTATMTRLGLSRLTLSWATGWPLKRTWNP